MVTLMLSMVTFYAIIWAFFKLLNWADTAVPEVKPVAGLCQCTVDPYAGVAGHCFHKAVRLPYIPRHATA